MAFDPFFYPLDAVAHWNRIYGRRGFFQYQFALPESCAPAIKDVFRIIADSGQASFLAVLKKFGSGVSPGLLSFPMEGITLALDFPNNGARTLELFGRLNEVVHSNGGRFYPAKDSTMASRAFQRYYPKWTELARFRDPKFSSSFWRRVTQHD
jgi:FAD/FMN-containing dehydrogenase